jgi:ATP-dependent DNA helicase RecG
VDKPDYADRAVTEALVNALIHRDYILLGSEIHIDMFDDRLEIQSPGGMYDGRAIQDREINTIASARRNPVIADLFHRMKFMERRGSGLTKILSETAKLPGYNDRLKPEFFSTPSDFRVVLKNVNYSAMADTPRVTPQATPQVTPQVSIEEMILQYCSIPRTKREIVEHFEYSDIKYFSKGFLKPLLESGRLQMTFPDKPSSPNQKYVAAEA